MNSITKVDTKEKDKAKSSIIPDGLKKPDYCPIVIDGDGHLMDHLTLWEERMKNGPYADRAPRAVPDREGLRVLVDGKLFPKPMGPGLGRPNGIRHHWANGIHYDHINSGAGVPALTSFNSTLWRHILTPLSTKP